MIYEVSTDKPPQLTLCEDDPLQSVLQNIYVILATRTGTVPMYRQFGLPGAFIDRPALAAETILAAEIREAIAEFEPRAALIDVSMESSAHGTKLTAKVKVKA